MFVIIRCSRKLLVTLFPHTPTFNKFLQSLPCSLPLATTRHLLWDLADSIARHGLIQPIVVREDGENPDNFIAVAGETRARGYC